jgi:hypothetical protein
MVEVSSAAMKSWLEYSQDTEFPLENIPFSVFFNPKQKQVHCCTRIGDNVIDLAVLEHERVLANGSIFSKLDKHIFCEENLNMFAGMGPEIRAEARQTLQAFFCDTNKTEILALSVIALGLVVIMYMSLLCNPCCCRKKQIAKAVSGNVRCLGNKPKLRVVV